MEKNKWWGYVHVNGSLQVKRFFNQKDISEARESNFVARIIQPFEANDREEALNTAKTYM